MADLQALSAPQLVPLGDMDQVVHPQPPAVGNARQGVGGEKVRQQVTALVLVFRAIMAVQDLNVTAVMALALRAVIAVPVRWLAQRVCLASIRFVLAATFASLVTVIFIYT